MTERQVERWWRLRRSQDKPTTLVKFCENAWKCTFYVCNFGVTNDIWWYYMVSSAFYWSLTLSQFWDVRRKDFWQMFVHHLATIALLSTTIRAPMLLPMFPAYYIFNSLLCLLLALHIVWTWLILQIAYKAIYAGKHPLSIQLYKRQINFRFNCLEFIGRAGGYSFVSLPFPFGPAPEVQLRMFVLSWMEKACEYFSTINLDLNSRESHTLTLYLHQCVYEFVAGVRARAAGVAGPLEQREADAAVLDGGEVPCGQSALRVERRAEGHARVARGLPALVVAPDHVVLRQLEVAEEAEDVFDAGAERNVLERQHAARRAEVFQRTVGVLLARVTSVAPVLVAAAPAPSTPPAVEAAVEAPVEAAPAAPALAVEPAAAPVEAAAAAVVPAAAALVEAAPVEASVEASAVEASAVKAAAASEAAALGRARVEEGLLVDRGRAEQRVARVALGPVQRVLDHGARHQVHGDAAALQPVAVLGGRAARLAHGPELAEAVAGRHAGRVQHQMDARRHRARVREERDDGAVGGVARQALHQHTVELLLGVGGRRGRGEAGPGGPAGGGGARVQPAAGVASELLRREAAAERLLGRRERRREERHAGLLGGCGGRGRVEGAALARVARRGGFGLLGRRGLPQGLPRGLRLLPLKRLLLIVLLSLSMIERREKSLNILMMSCSLTKSGSSAMRRTLQTAGAGAGRRRRGARLLLRGLVPERHERVHGALVRLVVQRLHDHLFSFELVILPLERELLGARVAEPDEDVAGPAAGAVVDHFDAVLVDEEGEEASHVAVAGVVGRVPDGDAAVVLGLRVEARAAVAPEARPAARRAAPSASHEPVPVLLFPLECLTTGAELPKTGAGGGAGMSSVTFKPRWSGDFRSLFRRSRDRRGELRSERSRERLRSLRSRLRSRRSRLRLRSRRRLSRERDRSRRSLFLSLRSRDLDRVRERRLSFSLLRFLVLSSSLSSLVSEGLTRGAGGSMTAGWGISLGLPIPGMPKPARPEEPSAAEKGVIAGGITGAGSGAGAGAGAGGARESIGTVCLAASMTLCISERELSSSFT
ncbi:hypothetical protein MSG28_005595 [Choristoneura fumiferana]|uniref:Uncharacterized protein n=1 Tax=Choristoneura fumiferana TaxID=7141 RepID=A0ACC0KZZ5_CHOFU|nr:hypothetical protein MSG28_005595 [Choristoneura fumiferana]